MKNKIIELFGEESLKRSAIRLRDGDRIIERFLKGMNYRTILEIGTYSGMTAAFMSQFCERVVTIDLEYGRMEQLGKDGPAERRNVWDALGITNIESHIVKNDDRKKQIVDALEFDFAFIDGAHDETVADDFDMVKKCGRVLFHEYDDTKPGQNYSYDFVNNNLGRDSVIVDDIFALWIAPGVSQKR